MTFECCSTVMMTRIRRTAIKALLAVTSRFYKTIANTSITPITVQTIALPRSPANQNPLAALKQRIALVHPLTNAPGLLNILRNFIRSFYGIGWGTTARFVV
jgi:hypothetical protein